MTSEQTASSSSNRSKEYTVNNYTILNAFIGGLISRDSAYTKFRWNEVWQSRIKIIILILISILLIMLIVFIFFRLNQGQILFGDSYKVSGYPQIQYVPVPDPDISQVIEKQVIVKVPEYIPIEIPTGKGVVTNFNIFRTVDINLNNVSEVTTGIAFSSSDKNYPDRQWCYAIGTKKVGNTGVKVDIGIIDGTGAPVWRELSPDEASETGISVDVFSSLSKSCLFMRPDEGFVREDPIEEPGGIQKGPNSSSGSSFAVNTEGYLLTNHHVVADCTAYKIFFDGDFYEARLIGSDKNRDLAVLQTSTNVTKSAFKFADTARTGESVIALGYPLFDDLGVSLKVTSGIISSLSGFRGDKNTLQFSAPIQPGNSGGPLVNNKNEVVAVATSVLTGDHISNVGFGIKGAEAQQFLAKHKIKFLSDRLNEALSVPKIVEAAEKMTHLVLCD